MTNYKTLYKFKYLKINEVPLAQDAFFNYMNTLFDGKLSWFSISKKMGVAAYTLTRYQKTQDHKDYSIMGERIRQDILFVAEEFLAHQNNDQICLSSRYKNITTETPSKLSLLREIKKLANLSTDAELAKYIGVEEVTLLHFMKKNRSLVGRILRDCINLRHDLLLQQGIEPTPLKMVERKKKKKV
jgi:hypothetical protein